MEYKDIKKLMDDMGNSKLDSLDIEFPDGVKISMKKTSPINMSNAAVSTTTEATVPATTANCCNRYSYNKECGCRKRKLQNCKKQYGWNILC